MADSRAALAEGQTLREGTSRAFSSRRTDEPAWKAARGWIVATLVALLAVGPATAAVSQTSPAPTPSPSAPVLTPEPAIPTPSPSAEPIITPEPAPADDLPKDGDALSQEDTAAADSPANVDGTAKVDESAPGPEPVIAPNSTMAPANLPNASGPWEYWIDNIDPLSAGVVAGDEVTYTLQARRQTTLSWTQQPVTNAVVTFELLGDVSNIEIADIGLNDGYIDVDLENKTVTWSGMNLNRTGLINNTRTISVTATVTPYAPDGALTATASPGATEGSFRSGNGRFEDFTHSVLGATNGNCSFADPNSGAFAQSICWFDMSEFDATQARSGQQMATQLPGDYKLSYRVTTSDATSPSRNGSNAGFNLVAATTPTWSGAYFGNIEYEFSAKGAFRPALYQGAAADGSTSRIVLSNITLTHPDLEAGDPTPGFALVGADAESTNTNEWIQWTSDKPLVSIGNLGNNACGGALQVTSATQVRCNGTGEGARDGVAILYSQNPTQFSQTMKGSGLQGVAFGVMVSGVQLSKQIENRVSPSDAFTITADLEGDELASVTTGDQGDPVSADTGQLHLIWSGGDVDVTLSEQPTAGTDVQNYLASWACYRNGEQFEPSGGEASKTVSVSFGDFVHCAITNTGPSLTLIKEVSNTADGGLEPSDWTLTATDGTNPPVIDEAPSHAVPPADVEQKAATNKVSVPVGQYTLSESSSAEGHELYAQGQWTCTWDDQNVPVNENVIEVEPGAQVVCTITNTYVPPAEVTISKVVLDTAGTPLEETGVWELGSQFASGDTSGAQITPAGPQESDIHGDVNTPWTVTFPTPEVTATVELSEQEQFGYKFVEAACTVNGTPEVTFDQSEDVEIEVRPGDQVACVITNQQIYGSVTWSKVADDAEETWLAGSEWTLSGPGVPADTVVLDCTTGSCDSGPFDDQAAAAGEFKLEGLAWGDYTLIESKAPAGYALAANPVTFTISATSLTPALAPVVNRQLAVPELPLTGGLSTDLFLALGAGLIAAAGIGAWIYRRRSVATSPY